MITLTANMHNMVLLYVFGIIISTTFGELNDVKVLLSIIKAELSTNNNDQQGLHSSPRYCLMIF